MKFIYPIVFAKKVNQSHTNSTVILDIGVTAYMETRSTRRRYGLKTRVVVVGGARYMCLLY